MNSVGISFESKCVTYLSAVHKHDNGDLERRPCTGFFWRSAGTPFLITCRHCVTGVDGNNNNVGDSEFRPTHLQTYFRTPGKKEDDGATFYDNQAIEFILWQKGVPKWQEHPDGATVDLAALEYSNACHEVHCVNDKEQPSFRTDAGSDCFIVGYPEGLGGSEGTPIWKRGSIASEPELKLNGQDCFLVDSATRSGMSGSPVFAKLMGDFGPEGVPHSPNENLKLFGFWTKFLGVYSGRNGVDDYGFQLGRVWKGDLIAETVSNKNCPAPPWKVMSPTK